MNIYTMNRNLISNDFMFVAACDRTCADLLDSYNMDRPVVLEASTGTSLSMKLKRIFLKK